MSSARRLLAVIVIARVALTVLCHFAGITAVSDDDFARVLISQEFSAEPRLDPSGTSWLPAPFWVTGSAMYLLSPSLMLARWVALGLAVLAALGVYLAGSLLGLGRRVAGVVALVATFLPHAVWLGVATVPEYPTAALILLAAATLVRREGALRVLGSIAITIAGLSRYEAWPVAAVFALFCGWDIVQRVRDARAEASAEGQAQASGQTPTNAAGAHHRRTLGALVLALGCSLSAPLAWLAHGLVRHHDPFFFFGRVAAYHRALGGQTHGWFEALRSQLAGLLCEPEALAAVAVLVVLFLVRRSQGFYRGGTRPSFYLGGTLGESHLGFGRFLVAILALLVFRVISEYTGGVPTHHAERTLLPVWLALLLFGGSLARSILDDVRESQQPRLVWAMGGLLLLSTVVAAAFLRPQLPPPQLQSRETEVTMGRLAQALVPKRERLAVCTEDYGYFAVQAAFGRPGQNVNLCDHDPRHKVRPNPLETRETMLYATRAKKARYLIASLDAVQPAQRSLTVLAVRGNLVLVKLP